MKTTLLFLCVFSLLASLHAPAAPGYVMEYINTTGGGRSDLGDIGEVRQIWQHNDLIGGIPSGFSGIIGGHTYNIQNHFTATGFTVPDIATGGPGDFNGTATLANINPGATATTHYTLRARAVLTFNCAGTYTIGTGSDDGRLLKITDINTAAPVTFCATPNVGCPGVLGQAEAWSPTVIGREIGGAHNNSRGEITVAAGDVIQIEAIMWQGTGGHSFEIFIGPGPGAAYPASFVLLTDDPFGDGCVTVDDQLLAPAPQYSPVPGWNVQTLSVLGGGGGTGGSNDGDFNNLNETCELVNFITTDSCFVNGLTPTLPDGKIWNVDINMVATTMFPDYNSNGTPNNAYENDQSFGLTVDDAIVRFSASVGIPVGEWSVAGGSDDGRIIQIDGVSFESMTGQQGGINCIPTGVATDAIGFNATTGHDETVGNFTVTPAMGGADGIFWTTMQGWFFERNGGQSFEISVASGAWGGTHWDGSGNYAGNHDLDQFRMLEDGVFGWMVTPLPVETVDPEFAFPNGDPASSRAVLNVSKTNVPGIDPGICPGDPITYDLRYANLGNESVCGTVLQDQLLSAGMNFAAISDNLLTVPLVDKCTGVPLDAPVTRVVNGNTIQWYLGTTNNTDDLDHYQNLVVPPGVSFSFQVYVETDTNAVDCAILTNSFAHMDPLGVVKYSETLDQTVIYYPDLAIGKDVTNLTFGGQECAFANDVLQYTLSVTNLGKGTAKNVVICETIPVGTTLNPASIGGLPPGATIDITPGSPEVLKINLGDLGGALENVGESTNFTGMSSSNLVSSTQVPPTTFTPPLVGTVLLNWLGDNFAAGAWPNSTIMNDAGADYRSTGIAPISVGIGCAENAGFTGQGSAVNFDGTGRLIRNSLGEAPADLSMDSVTLVWYLSPASLNQRAVIWETGGGIDGTALVQNGNFLVFGTSDGGGGELHAGNVQVDLAAINFTPGTDFLYVIATIDFSRGGEITLAAYNRCGQGAISPTTLIPANGGTGSFDDWAGQDDEALGGTQGSIGGDLVVPGVYPNGQFQDLAPGGAYAAWQGQIASVSVYEDVSIFPSSDPSSTVCFCDAPCDYDGDGALQIGFCAPPSDTFNFSPFEVINLSVDSFLSTPGNNDDATLRQPPNVLTDGFAYNPATPLAPAPQQPWSGGIDHWHPGAGGGRITLDLPAHYENGFIDIWTRTAAPGAGCGPACLARDNNSTIQFFSGPVLVHEEINVTIPDGVQYLRYPVPAGISYDRFAIYIEVDSAAIAEIRAFGQVATVQPVAPAHNILTGASFNSLMPGVAGFGSNPLNVLNSDPFAFNPAMPHSPAPAQVYGGATHFHNNIAGGAGLLFDLNSAQENVHLDLWGRVGCPECIQQDRGENLTITFFNNGIPVHVINNVSIPAERTNTSFPGLPRAWNRFYLPAGLIADQVEVFGPSQNFTLAEARLQGSPVSAVPAVCPIVCTGVYTAQLNSCESLISWELLDLDYILNSPGSSVAIEILDPAGTSLLGPFTNQAITSLTTLPAITNLQLVITLNSCTEDICDAPIVEGYEATFRCVPEGSNITFEVIVDECIPPGLAVISNTVTITNDVAETELDLNVATTNIALKSFDLVLSKIGTDLADCNDTLTYTLNVDNIGTATALNAVVIDQLNPALALATIPTNCSVTGQTVFCTIASLAPGASQMFVLDTLVVGCPSTMITNQAMVTMCGDFNPSNNIAVVTNTVPNDNMPPILDLSTAPDLEICNVDPSGNFGDATIIGECILTNGFTDAVSVSGCVVRVERTHTVANKCGDSTSGVQVILIHVDLDAPSLSIPQNENLCNETVTDFNFLSGALGSDVCDGTVLPTFVSASVMTGCVEVITRIWTATDFCGNTQSMVQVISNTMDIVAPMVVAPTNVVGCNLDLDDLGALGTATVTDACLIDPILTYTDTVTTVSCTDAVERVWYAVDDCGNVGVATQMIANVIDTDAPVFDTFPDDLNGCGVSTNVVDSGSPTASDPGACGLVTTSFVDTVTIQNGNTIVLREWSAADECGNTNSQIQTIIVIADFAPPVVLAPEDTAFCDTNGIAVPPTSITGVATFVPSCCTNGTTTVSFVDAAMSPIDCGTLVERVWTATDGCGMSASATQMIAFLDSDMAGPTFAPVTNLSVCNVSDASPAAIGGVVVTDDCTIETNEWVDTMTIDGCNTIIERIWTATDTCGNSATVTQIVTVVDDTEAPMLTLPADVTDCNVDLADTNATGVATATDNCDGTTTVSFVDVATMQDCVMIVSRTWTATDPCGNSASDVQVILSTIDTNAPMVSGFSAPIVGTVGASGVISGCNLDLSPIALGQPIATDPCSAPTMTFTDVVTSDGCLDNIVRTWDVSDDCGNTVQVVQTIENRLDTTAPVFSLFPMDTTACNSSEPGFTGIPVVLDDCSQGVSVITNAFDSPNDVVTLTVDVPTGSTLAVDTFASPFDTQLFVFDLSLTPLIANDDDPTGGGGLQSQVTNLPSGQYVIHVTRWNNDPVDVNGVSLFLGGFGTSGPNPAAGPFDRYNGLGNLVTGPAVITLTGGDLVAQPTFTDVVVPAGCQDIIYRTWSAIDGCGNEVSEVQTIFQSNDTTPPVLTIPADVELCINPAVTNLTGSATAIDDCGNIALSFTDVVTIVTCEFVNVSVAQSIQRIWSATDDCGNETLGTQSITRLSLPVGSQVLSIITDEPEDVTGCDIDLSTLVQVTAEGCFDITTNYTETISNIGCTQIIHRMWTFHDVCGTRTTDQMVFNILDVNPPLLVNPPDYIACAATDLSPAVAGMATASESCTEAVLTWVDLPRSTDCGEILERTWIATDLCGNSTTSDVPQIIINTTNAAPPTVTFLPADVMSVCNVDVDNQPDATADGCPGMVTMFSSSSSQAGCDVTTLRVWTFVNPCAEITVTQTIVSAADIIPPSLDVPPDVDGCNLADLTPAALGMASSTDACGNVSITWIDSTTNLGCLAVISREWTAMDDCGYMTFGTQTIFNVTDTDAPVLVMPPDFYACNINGPATPLDATATDACGSVTVSSVDAFFQSNCQFIVQRTWTATDACGNEASDVQTITTETDPSQPMITLPPDATVCDGSPTDPSATGEPVVNDTCSDAIVDFADTSAIVACGEVISRTWTAVDRCGFTNSAVQTITVLSDSDAPVITVADESFCMMSTNAVVATDATVTDTCSSVTLDLAETSSINGCDEEVVRVWTATDACGNVSVATQTVTISRDLNFGWTPAADVSGCNLDTTPAGAGEPVVTSDCDITPPTFSDVVTTTNCLEIIVRTWSVNDICGTPYELVQMIENNIDTTAPVLALAPDVVGCDIATDPSSTGMTTAEDDCGNITVSSTDSVSTVGCDLLIERTWTAVDGCGNSTSAVQNITSILSAALPELTVPADVDGCNMSTNVADTGTATATDDCGDVAVSFIDTVTTDGCAVTVTRTWTAEDVCGQTVSGVQTIQSLNDSAAPVVTAPADEVGCNLLVDSPTVFATVADDCSDTPVTFEDTKVTDGCVVTITRVWSAEDDCGNVGATTQVIINTVDSGAPTISIPPDVVGCSLDTSENITGVATAQDECSVTVTSTDSVATDGCQTTITRTFTASDGCGNEVTGVQTIINIVDTDTPTISCPDTIIVSANTAGNYVVPDLTGTPVTDSCGATITQSPAAGTVFGRLSDFVVASQTVTLTAEDGCGNEATCSVDLINPSCIGDTVFADGNLNGTQDAGEGGIPNVVVLLLDGLGNELSRATTDATGKFIFFMDIANNTVLARGTPQTFQLGYIFPGATETTTQAPFTIGQGEHDLDQDIGLALDGSISGVVWNDIANTGDPAGANLAELGYNGATVNLLSVEGGVTSVVATTVTSTDAAGNMGTYNFPGLPPGDYIVQIDPASLPDALAGEPKFETDPIGLGAGQNLVNGTNFPLMFGSGPTAIELVSIEATGGSLTWTTSDESGTLGYNVIDLATGEAINDSLILANGNGGTYSQDVSEGDYALETIDDDLSVNREAEVTHFVEVDASPTGDPTSIVEATNGSASFSTSAAADSYLVIGIASGAIVLDVTDPDNPVRLIGESLATDGGNAVYFSYAAGASIQIR